MGLLRCASAAELSPILVTDGIRRQRFELAI
jgi:hypothetical protein